MTHTQMLLKFLYVFCIFFFRTSTGTGRVHCDPFTAATCICYYRNSMALIKVFVYYHCF